MSAELDKKTNTQIRYTRDGYQVERKARVYSVSGTAEDILYNAITDAQLPSIGAAHPSIPDITLNDMVCTALGGGNFEITLRYYKDSGVVTSKANAESRTRTGLAVEETHKDLNGVALQTSYSATPSSGPSRVLERFTAEVERPRIEHQFEYTDTNYPTSDISKYLGKVNNSTWNGYAAGEVLCSSIDVVQSGSNFRVTYTFSVRDEGWIYLAKTRYAPPLNEHPIDPDPELDLETGIRPFNVYRTVNFDGLGFVLENSSYRIEVEGGKIPIKGGAVTLTVS